MHILVLASIRFTPEHVVAEVDAGSMFQVQRHSIDHGVVDGDIPVLLNFTGVSSFDFKYREGSLESKFIIYQMTEPQGKQITDSKSEVDSNDE